MALFDNLNQSELYGPFKAYQTDAVTGLVTWTDTRWALMISTPIYDELRQMAVDEGYTAQFDACIYEPTEAQIEQYHLPVWAGGAPAPRYLRLPLTMTRTQLRRVLRRLITD